IPGDVTLSQGQPVIVGYGSTGISNNDEFEEETLEFARTNEEKLQPLKEKLPPSFRDCDWSDIVNLVFGSEIKKAIHLTKLCENMRSGEEASGGFSGGLVVKEGFSEDQCEVYGILSGPRFDEGMREFISNATTYYQSTVTTQPQD
ncbi:MAG: hypothetical protein LBS71_01825, partial [Puniceicoccales bacterium]|nr:hypothetical protein [Puniceicoccales bacterium]